MRKGILVAIFLVLALVFSWEPLLRLIFAYQVGSEIQAKELHFDWQLQPLHLFVRLEEPLVTRKGLAALLSLGREYSVTVDNGVLQWPDGTRLPFTLQDQRLEMEGISVLWGKKVQEAVFQEAEVPGIGVLSGAVSYEKGALNGDLTFDGWNVHFSDSTALLTRGETTCQIQALGQKKRRWEAVEVNCKGIDKETFTSLAHFLPRLEEFELEEGHLDAHLTKRKSRWQVHKLAGQGVQLHHKPTDLTVAADDLMGSFHWKRELLDADFALTGGIVKKGAECLLYGVEADGHAAQLEGGVALVGSCGGATYECRYGDQKIDLEVRLEPKMVAMGDLQVEIPPGTHAVYSYDLVNKTHTGYVPIRGMKLYDKKQRVLLTDIQGELFLKKDRLRGKNFQAKGRGAALEQLQFQLKAGGLQDLKGILALQGLQPLPFYSEKIAFCREGIDYTLTVADHLHVAGVANLRESNTQFTLDLADRSLAGNISWKNGLRGHFEGENAVVDVVKQGRRWVVEDLTVGSVSLSAELERQSGKWEVPFLGVRQEGELLAGLEGTFDEKERVFTGRVRLLDIGLDGFSVDAVTISAANSNLELRATCHLHEIPLTLALFTPSLDFQQGEIHLSDAECDLSPLVIKWEEGNVIKSVRGACAGIAADLEREEEHLVGKVRVEGSPLLSKKIKKKVGDSFSMEGAFGFFKEAGRWKVDIPHVAVVQHDQTKKYRVVQAEIQNVIGDLFHPDSWTGEGTLHLTKPLSGKIHYTLADGQIVLQQLKKVRKKQLGQLVLSKALPSTIDFSGNLNLHLRLKHAPLLYKLAEWIPWHVRGTLSAPKINWGQAP